MAPAVRALLLLLCAFLTASPAPVRLDTPPNVLFVMVDDMGWADAGCYGSTAIPTPNIDRLAAGGTLFTQAYAGAPVCAPSRSVLMTGMHAGHTSVRTNTGGAPLLDEDVTLAEILHRSGYATGGFGKWGLGDLGTTGVPERQGFDEFYGYYHQVHAHDYLPAYLIRNSSKELLPGNERVPGTAAPQGPFRRIDSRTGRVRRFSADLIAEATLDFIRSHAERPFFCYAAWTPPHGGYTIPEDDPAWRAFARKSWPMRTRVVAAYIAWIDRRLGELLDLLEELDIADRTLVVFTSDNGAEDAYVGSLNSCGPLRGVKRSVHEGGLRVPFLVRWNGRIPAGRVTDSVIWFADVLPTLAAAAGVEPELETDGRSLLPFLLGEEDEDEARRARGPLYWEWEQYDWAARAPVPDGLQQAGRIGNWKAVRAGEGRPIELYDLFTDVGETRDLAARRADLVQRFEELFRVSHTPMRPQREPEMPPESRKDARYR